MALQFTDADFQEAWKELDEPQLQGEWELFTESMGVKIYRLYNKETGLYEYKVFGTLSSCSPELCADVYMDLAYRKQWDSYVKALGEKPFRYLEVLVFIDWKRLPEGSFWKKSPGLIPENSQSAAQFARRDKEEELHEKDYDGQKAIYWEVKYPFPLSNRDYVYVRERRDLQVNGRKIWVVLARSSAVSHCPEKSGIIRVKDYKQTVAMETDGAQGTKIFMNYFDNPGGNIPAWLINWAAKSGVPGFLKDMQDACTKYATYCKNRK